MNPMTATDILNACTTAQTGDPAKDYPYSRRWRPTLFPRCPKCEATPTIAMLFCVAGLAACDDDDFDARNMDLSMMGADMTVPDMAVNRTADVPLAFQPEGLWWDSATQALYIANDGGQQIVKWNEPSPNFSGVFARLPDIAPTASSSASS